MTSQCNNALSDLPYLKYTNTYNDLALTRQSSRDNQRSAEDYGCNNVNDSHRSFLLSVQTMTSDPFSRPSFNIRIMIKYFKYIPQKNN